MYLWGGRWSPHLTPPPSWTSPNKSFKWFIFIQCLRLQLMKEVATSLRIPVPLGNRKSGVLYLWGSGWGEGRSLIQSLTFGQPFFSFRESPSVLKNYFLEWKPSLRKQINEYKPCIRESHASGNSPAAVNVMTKEYKFRDMNSWC